MNYTTYLFDFDYTLADSSRGIVTCFRNVLNRHGYAEVTEESIKHTIGKTLEESFSILTGVTDAETLAVYKQEYTREADIHMTANTRFFPETKQVLTALKETGAKVGIISTKYRYRINELVCQHFPEGFFDIIVGGEDVKVAKPSPEGLLLAIRELQADKIRTLYIGDSIVDAQTAEAANVDFAGVTHGVTTAEELSAYPHRLIMASLEELLKTDTPPAPSGQKKFINPFQAGWLLLWGWLLWESNETFLEEDWWLFFLIFALSLSSIMHKRRILPPEWEAALRQLLHPLTVRRRAFHIRQIRGKETPRLNPESCTCRNCGYTFIGNFCPRCGQGRHTLRYRLKDAPGSILRTIFRVDGRFARTLMELTYRPGHLMRDFIQGRRIHYTPPLVMVFLMTAFYILTAQLIAPGLQEKRKEDTAVQTPLTKQEELRQGIAVLEEKMADPELTPIAKESVGLTLNTLQQQLHQQMARDSVEGTPELTTDSQYSGYIQTASRRISHWTSQVPFLQHVWNLLKQWGHGNKALHILLTLPLLAVATSWAFRRYTAQAGHMPYNLMEHFFIQAYIAAQILVISIFSVLLLGDAHTEDLYEVPWWLIFILFWWDYRQLYLCTWLRSFWRTVAMFAYCLLIIILLAFFAVFILWLVGR